MLQRTLIAFVAIAALQLLHAKQVVLTWNDNSDNEEGFSVERSTNGSDFEVIAQVEADVATYTDLAIEPGSDYQYRVNAFNAFGYSGYTNVATHHVNVSPSVSAIDNVQMQENGSLSGLAFTIEDLETAEDDLEVSVTSSNTDVLDGQGIVVGGSGAQRTLSLAPKANASGETTLTLSVSDGEETVQTSFTVAVSAFVFPTIDFAVATIGSGARAGESFVLTSTVSDPAKVASVSYLVNGELAASSIVAPYEVDVSVPEAGAYTVTAVASVVGRDETVTSTQELLVGNAPADSEFVAGLRTLSTDDATSEGAAGYDLFSDTFYVEDRGGQIVGASDTHRYYYVRVDGDVAISAKVSDLLASSNSAVAGLMVRSALYGKSAQSSILVDGAGSLQTRNRAVRGDDVQSQNGPSIGASEPWLKLERTGDTVKTYYRTSETAAWSLVEQTQVDLTDPVFVGFAVAAGPNDEIASAEFRDAALTGQILAWDDSSTKPAMPGSLIISQN